MKLGLIERIRNKKQKSEEGRQMQEKMLYRSVLEETNTGVYVRDVDSCQLLYINRRAREIFGVAEEDYQQKSCYELFHGLSEPCKECQVYERQGDKVPSRELLRDGRYYVTKGRIIDWRGREAYVEYLLDITDSKIVSEQMREAHERLQKKYEEELLYREKAVSEDMLSTSRVNLTQGIVEEMRIGNADGYEKIYRHAVNFVDRVATFTRDMWLTDEQSKKMSAAGLLEQFEQGINSATVEYIAELKNGHHVWIRGEANLLRRPDTSDVLAFVYNRDITSERILKDTLSCIMSFDYDEIYTVDSVNELFDVVVMGQYALENQKMSGTYEEELQSLIARAATPEDAQMLRREMAIPNLREVLQYEPMHLIEVTMLSRNGKMRRKQIRCMYLYERVGTILVTLADIEDALWEEKKKQDQLAEALSMAREASQAKSNFLASMSHEIRTPMNAIIGLNSIIRDEINNKEQVLDCTEKLDSASRYLLALLNDILDMSRIESGNMTLAKQLFDSDKFWDNVNILAKTQAKIKGVQYEFSRTKKTTGSYLGDVTRLEQIMINLINNAIKFTATEGYVKVTASENESVDGRIVMRVTVEDNGVGISREFLPHVFDTFARQHKENSTSYQGSGLGLSIAKNFARMMQGDITVESTEGNGTVFTVWVRLEKAPEEVAANVAPKEEETIDFTGKKVLLVEDHPLNTVVAERLLKKRGFAVVHAEDGVEAVELFDRSEVHEYDAILMDIRMPRMDGIEATTRIRALERADADTVPIIAMTANAYEEDREHTREAGMNAHLAKPINPDLLFETLAEYIPVEK